MEIFTYRGMVVRIWEKSFSINNAQVVWIGNDNSKEVICGLIDTVADFQQEAIKGQLRNILGIKS